MTSWQMIFLLGLWATLCFGVFRVMAERGKAEPSPKEDREKGWFNTWHNNEVHTVPKNDLIVHTFEDCICKPETVPVPTEDGSMNWQVIHDAKDGRE